MTTTKRRGRNLFARWPKKTEKAAAVDASAPVPAAQAKAVESGRAALEALALQPSSSAAERTAGSDAASFGAALAQGNKSQRFRRIGAALSATVAGAGALAGAAPASADMIAIEAPGQKEDAALDIAKLYARVMGEEFHEVLSTDDALNELFARAEAGEIDLSTLIITESAVGSRFHEGHDNVSPQKLVELQKRFPKAASQVKRLYLLESYGGGRANTVAWQKPFPNLQAVVGWADYKPRERKQGGALVEQVERAFRQEDPDRAASPAEAILRMRRIAAEAGNEDADVGIRTPFGHAAGTDHLKSSYEVFLRVGSQWDEVFAPYVHGIEGFEMPDHDDETLRELEASLAKAYAQMNDNPQRRTAIGEWVGEVRRMRSFDIVRKNMQSENGHIFAAANQEYEKAGISFRIPDVSNLDRGQLASLADEMGEMESLVTANIRAEHADAIRVIHEFDSYAGAPSVPPADAAGEVIAEAMVRWYEELTPTPKQMKEARALLRDANQVALMDDATANQVQRKQILKSVAKARVVATKAQRAKLPTMKEVQSMPRQELRDFVNGFYDSEANIGEFDVVNAIQAASYKFGDFGKTAKETLLTHACYSHYSALLALSQFSDPGLVASHYGSVLEVDEGGDFVKTYVANLEAAFSRAEKISEPTPAVVAAYEEIRALWDAYMDEGEPDVVYEAETLVIDGLLYLRGDVIPDHFLEPPPQVP